MIGKKSSWPNHFVQLEGALHTKASLDGSEHKFCFWVIIGEVGTQFRKNKKNFASSSTYVEEVLDS